MPFDDAKFSSLVSDIYDCAIDPDRWPDALANVAAAMNAAYVAINLHANATLSILRVYHSPFDQDALKTLHQRYLPHLPGIEEFLALDIDTPSVTSRVVPTDVFRASTFFREWAEPNRLGDGCMVKYLQTRDVTGSLSAIAALDRDPISDDEARLAQMLAPHVRRSIMIGEMIDRARIEARRYRATLDAIDAAVVLTNADGAVLCENAAASAILEKGSVIAMRNGRLEVRAPARRASFADALARAAAGDLALGRRGVSLPLNAPGEPMLLAHVLPLAHSPARRAFDPATVAIFLSRRAQDVLPDATLLMTLFDLTPSEARVMGLIGSGRTVAQAASDMGAGVATVRTHLSQVFAKTGAARQADIVRLVADIRPLTHV